MYLVESSTLQNELDYAVMINKTKTSVAQNKNQKADSLSMKHVLQLVQSSVLSSLGTQAPGTASVWNSACHRWRLANCALPRIPHIASIHVSLTRASQRAALPPENHRPVCSEGDREVFVMEHR